VSGKRFPRDARLLTPKAFDEVFRAGLSAGSKFFRALVTRSPTAQARLGITVPKRVVRAAHDRNRIKRLLRESFRQQRAALPPVDLVILARGPIQQADSAALRQDIEAILRRAVALKPPPATGTMPVCSSPTSLDPASRN